MLLTEHTQAFPAKKTTVVWEGLGMRLVGRVRQGFEPLGRDHSRDHVEEKDRTLVRGHYADLMKPCLLK